MAVRPNKLEMESSLSPSPNNAKLPRLYNLIPQDDINNKKSSISATKQSNVYSTNFEKIKRINEESGETDKQIIQRFSDATKVLRQMISTKAKEQANSVLKEKPTVAPTLDNSALFDLANIQQEPEFNEEELLPGPDLNDDRAFKLITCPSDSSKQLCIIHPKVLRWISVAKEKLKEVTTYGEGVRVDSLLKTPDMLHPQNFTDPQAGSTIEISISLPNLDNKYNVQNNNVPITYELLSDEETSSCTSRSENSNPTFKELDQTAHLKDVNVTLERLDEVPQQGRLDEVPEPSHPKKHQQTNLSANADLLPSIPEIYHNELYKDSQTIGQAAAYWWGKESSSRADKFENRMHIIRHIRSFYQAPQLKLEVKYRFCWWCAQTSVHRIFAIFINEQTRPTCPSCIKRMRNSGGCITRIEVTESNNEKNFYWWELPQIYDDATTGLNAMKQLLVDKYASAAIKKRKWKAGPPTALEKAVPPIPEMIRCQIFTSSQTIGQALDYWWSKEGSYEPECYKQRVNVIRAIRKLYQPFSSKAQSRKICWWCKSRCIYKLKRYAIFINETPRPTCQACQKRSRVRTGCITRIQKAHGYSWHELPRIYDETNSAKAMERLIADNLCFKSASRGSQCSTVTITTQENNTNPTLPVAAQGLITKAARKETHQTTMLPDEPSIPQVYRDLKFTEDQTIGQASDYWWSDKCANKPERYKQRVLILTTIRNIYQGIDKDGICWWCCRPKQHLKKLVIFAQEKEYRGCFSCRMYIWEQAGCFTRLSLTESNDPVNFVWWELPSVYENLQGTAALHRLRLDKLRYVYNRKSRVSKLTIRQNTSSKGNAEHEIEKTHVAVKVGKRIPTKPIAQRFKAQFAKKLVSKANSAVHRSKLISSKHIRSHNTIPSIPEVYSNYLLPNGQTIGQSSEYWWGEDSGGKPERFQRRVFILTKIRQIYRPKTENAPGCCWWCGNTSNKRLRRFAVFANEKMRWTCLCCKMYTWRRAGCITRVPLADSSASKKFVWWTLPQVYENLQNTTALQQLIVDNLRHGYPRERQAELQHVTQPTVVAADPVDDHMRIDSTGAVFNNATSSGRQTPKIGLATKSKNVAVSLSTPRKRVRAVRAVNRTPSIPDMYRNHQWNDEQTIGQAADYWWGHDSLSKPECFMRRVLIIVKIRQLYGGPLIEDDGPETERRLCWWCGQRDRTVTCYSAIFVFEIPQHLCTTCYKRNRNRCGSLTRIPFGDNPSTFVWWKLPLIYGENVNGDEAMKMLMKDGFRYIAPTWVTRKRNAALRNNNGEDCAAAKIPCSNKTDVSIQDYLSSFMKRLKIFGCRQYKRK